MQLKVVVCHIVNDGRKKQQTMLHAIGDDSIATAWMNIMVDLEQQQQSFWNCV